MVSRLYSGTEKKYYTQTRTGEEYQL